MSVDSSPSNVLSVCTGMYGLDLGFDIAAERCLGRPVRTVCGVEREAYCAEVLATRMEEECLAPFPVWSNLKTFDGRQLRGIVDWVVGGYPCQPFSQAGKRKGVDDPRHLWPDIARIIRELGGPRTEGSLDGLDGCFFENVRGHLTLGLDIVVGELRAMGFEVAAGLFSAEEVGASHRRERIFILAIRPELVNTGCQRIWRDSGGPSSEEEASNRGRQSDGPFFDRLAESGAGVSGILADAQLSSTSRLGAVGDDGLSETEQRRSASDIVDAMDDAASPRHKSSGSRQSEQPEGRKCLSRLGCETMADDDDEGLEGRRVSVGQRRDELLAGTSGSKVVGLFAPGPAAFDRWGEVLLRFRPDLAPALPVASKELLGELEAEPQSELRRVVDGLAPRLERLRGLGNGVVPLEAAYALSYLFNQHRTGGPLVYRD